MARLWAGGRTLCHTWRSHLPLFQGQCFTLHRKYFGLTFASSPPKPPKFKPLLWPCKLDGGRPPLAGGCGIGEGDVDGEVMRGFVGVFTANELDDWFG